MNNDATYFAKQSGGCILRRTRKHDGTGVRHYAGIEVQGKMRFIRIGADEYNRLNDVLAKVKCAFTTNIRNNGTVQQQHAISI